ncbi:MAG: hypothetical protein ABI723_25365 [Bacteroidia bacterium]
MDYVQKIIVEHQYKKHLKKLPARFNLLTELNKFKEHKEQQQKNNLPDFNHQLSLSAHYQIEDLSLPVQVSTPLIFTQQEFFKPFSVFFSNTAPPPRLV